MTKFLSGRQKNLKIGITSYSENTQVLEVIGRVGIGSTVFSASYDLDVRGTSRFSGNVTLGANLYPDTDGLYDVGRAPNRWKDANFLGKGTFGTGVSAHDIELGVSSANLIYSTSGNLELNSQSGITNIDDIVTISGNLGIGTINPQQKLWVEGNGYFSGILTAQRIISSLYGEFISGTSIVGTALSISGISTFTNGPVLIGSGTSTGTAGQILQVSGINSSVYIGGNLGIGVTNSTSALQVNGRIYSGNNISTSNISNIVVKNIGVGYSAERSFNLVDTSAAIKIVRTHDSFGAILDLHQWNAGITTMLSYWDIVSESGTFSIRDRIGNYTKTNPEISRLFINSYGNVLLGASSNNGLNNIAQSVGYGTANILQVNGNSYLGGFVGIGTTTPTSKLWVDGDGYFTGVVTATTFIGNLSGTATTATNLSNAANITTGTIDKDRLLNSNSFSVLGDLYVSNNISFGGTTTQLNLQQLQIVDADIVLGIGTSFSPTDNTANHGGIAIASTEGSPLVNLNIVPEETNPSTYKKIMWFKGDAIGAGITDAWLFNYAVGIGTTQVPNGVRLAAGGMQVTDTTISTPNLNISGVGTFQSSGLKIRNPANTFGYTIAGGAIGADYTLTLPVVTANTGIALTGIAQTFTQLQTYNNGITVAAGTFNHSTSIGNFTAQSYTTGTFIVGGASQTGTITLGQATVSQTTNIQAGVSGVGTTKTINFGTGGASGSFTQINIGPTAGVGTVVINSGTNLGIGTTTPTSALTVVGNVLVSGISTLGVTTTTNLTAQQLNVSGITTVGFLTATNISVSGIVTSNAYYIGTTQVISSARQLQNIASLDATTTATIESAITNAPNTFTDLQVTGVSTFTNGPVLIGTGTSTGTANQRLQVTGGAYVSGNLGLGVVNPATKLEIDGVLGFTGDNIKIGNVSTGSSITTGFWNFFAGSYAGQFTTSGYDNNFFGFNAGRNNTTGSNNIFVGQSAGYNNETGSENVIIGKDQNAPILNGSNQLVIGAGSTAWITGNSSYNVGIGTTNPTSKLHITGPDFPLARIERVSSLISNRRSTISAIHKTSADMVDGFGADISFGIKDSSGIDYEIANFGAIRDGADDSGALVFCTSLNGTTLGTAKMILKSDGNVGIGTTNPGEKLQVDGNIRVGVSATSNYIAFRGTTGDDQPLYNHTYIGERIWGGYESSELLLFKGNDINPPPGYGPDRIRLAASQVRIDTYVTSTSGTFDSVGISTNLINRVVVHSTGEVGIGTSVLTGTASQLLQVTGGAYVSGSVGIGTTNPQTKLDISGDIRVSSGSTFVFGTGLGIGATAPGYTYALSNPFTSVQIGGTANRRGNALVDITAANYPDGTNVLNVQTTSETYTGTIGTYKPYTPAGTVIEIGNTRASQRVGIGSTLFGRSAALISIYAYNNDNVTNAFFGAVAGDVSNGPSNFVFGRRTGAFSWEETVRIDTSGNLGIGTTNPTSKLHVVGDTYISGILTATDINSASDIRLKTNIKPFENTLEKIVQINGVSFNWIDSNAKSGGIIAQDVEKVFPELVNDGDHKTVNYNGLIGVLIESIKELKQEVEDLKSRLGEI